MLILALLVLVALYISRPFFEREAVHTASLAQAQADSAEHERSILLAERDRILNALQELDFDFALGKIPEEDYPGQRQRLVQTGARCPAPAGCLAAAESSRSTPKRAWRRPSLPGAPRPLNRRGAGCRTGASPVVAVAGADDELEKLLADRRRVRREKAAGFCPQCGGPMQKSDRFCPKCGAKIA